MKWVLTENDEVSTASLIASARLHPLIARLMVNRGIRDCAVARDFLACDLTLLSDPAVFSGMQKAVDRIQRALSLHEKIVVYGDYDVDGVTGASVLFLALKSLGAEVHCYIPDRLLEGYGLNCKAVEDIRSAGAHLIITVDCGISAVREAELASSLGLDLIITDHHEIYHSKGAIEPALPNAYAVLHPSCLVPDRDDAVHKHVVGLTGAGMAFKLVQALLGAEATDERLASYLDLVTLGTVADVGKIVGENRVLVKHGLDRLSADNGAQRPGISALKEVAGLQGKRISVGTVGFSLAPRINASGRLERADMAFRLLTTDSPEEARELAKSLDAVNKERQDVEEAITEQARQSCLKEEAGAFVLSAEDWHPGVIGIVASRIVEEFYRPAALISVKDGIGKGSARSIPGFDLYAGLARCSDLLLGFGGHKYAAGFTIAEARIPEFRDRLNSIVLQDVGPEGFTRVLSIDGSVTLDELTMELMEELEKLAPFGQGNPEPKLGSRRLEVISSRVVGKNHLKLRLKGRSGTALDAIAFKRGDLMGRVRDGSRVAAVFTPRINAWNGKSAVELEIRDIKMDNENANGQNHNAKSSVNL